MKDERLEITLRVVNQEDAKILRARGWTVVYIGRPSVLGNPFKIGRDGDRATVIASYRRWLWARMHDDDRVRDALAHLAELVREGAPLALSCHCAPKPCHGDVLVNAIEWINRDDRRVA